MTCSHGKDKTFPSYLLKMSNVNMPNKFRLGINTGRLLTVFRNLINFSFDFCRSKVNISRFTDVILNISSSYKLGDFCPIKSNS